MINKFEEENSLELPEEIKSLTYLIKDGYDYETFYFKWESDIYLLLRDIYLNDGELLEITYPSFERTFALHEIIQNKVNDFKDDSGSFFVFAFSPETNYVLGYYYMDQVCKGVHRMSINDSSTVKYISRQIEGVLFEYLSSDHEFRFYHEFSKILYEQGKQLPPKVINEPVESIYLYAKNEDIEILFYTDILNENEYIITDSEWFEDERSYQLLLAEINQLTKKEVQFISKATIADSSENYIQIDKNVIEEYLLASDYVNPNFFQLLNQELLKSLDVEKEIVQFWDIRFGQEIGLAFLSKEQKENLKRIGTAKVYNFEERRYE